MCHPKRFGGAVTLAGVLLTASTLATSLTTSVPAHADEAATADALFRAGRAAMQRGDYADAVARFGESQRLEPAPGTLVNLAVAEDKLGRLAAAWEHARSAAEQLAVSDDRQKVARELFASLDKRVPRIVLRVAGPLIDGAQVKLDGAELRAASFGLPIPVDPGAHRVTIEAKGHVDRVVRVTVAEGSTTEQTLEVGPALVLGTPVHETTANSAATEPSSSRSPLRTAGFITLGVGAAAAIGGGVFGVLTIDRNNVVESHCPSRFCDRDGVDAASDGRTFARLSTGFFIGSAVLALSGVILIMLAPRSAPVARSDGLRF